MYKILLVFGATTFLVLFSLANAQSVPVDFVVAGPTQMRLIFLLLIAAASGFLFAYVRGLGREIQLKREVRRLLRMHDTVLARVSHVQLPERQLTDDDEDV